MYMGFSVVHVVIIYLQNFFNKTNEQMYMKWLKLDHNTVGFILFSTSVYSLLHAQRLKRFFLTFVSPTLSPSGEIIARISLVFVSAALLAEVAATKPASFRLLCSSRKNYTRVTGWRSACACAVGVGEMFKAFVRASYWLY